MSKVKLSAVLDDLRGKINNVVFQQSKSGLNMRTRVIPFNPQSTLQSVVRSVLSVAAKAFGQLTEAQIAAWNTLAATYTSLRNVFGEMYTISGANLHSTINANLAFSDQPLSSVAPAAVSPVPVPEPASIYLDAAPGVLTLNVSGFTGTGVTLVVSLAPVCSLGRSKPIGNYRKAANYVADLAATDMLSLYTTVFGTAPTVGLKFWVRLTWVNQDGFAKVGSDLATKVK